MKTPSLILCVAALATTSHAANCTMEQLTTLATMPEYMAIATSCAGLSSATTAATASQATFCNATCLTALEAAIKVVPVCEVGGASLSASYSSVVTACKAAKSAAPTTTSTSLFAMAVTAGSALMGVVMIMM